MANAAEQYYKNHTKAIAFYEQFLNSKPSDRNMTETAKQRLKILKEQQFMKGKGK